MSKRFIVAIDRSNQEQNKAFLDYIQSQNLGWWHWIENFWLLVDTNNKLTAAAIRDKLDELYPSITNMVIELSASWDTWAGFGPSTKERDMFQWLKDTWTKNR